MAGFHEIRFPDDISRGSSGGPERRTDIVEMRSGAEERNAIWKNSRRKYNAGVGLRNIDDIYKVLEFFEARNGRLYGFRWKDWSDYRDGPPNKISSVNQIGGPSGTIEVVGTQLLKPIIENAPLIGAVQFQLRKTYTSGNVSYSRTIQKPVAGTVRIWKTNNTVTTYVEGTHFSVNYTNGIVSFASAPIPTSTTPPSILRASFEFDVPVRFEKDSLSVNVEVFSVGGITDIGIVEIKV